MKKTYTLKRELTLLMILTSVCTLLSVCAAVFYVFFSFFFQKTQEDIEYVLRYTSQQYEAHMQFIEDSVIAIRHNTVLDDFFQKEEYDLEEIEPQLSYSMELFSERNMVERQLPFVTGIYLFNNGNECIYEHYYATTLAAGREQKRKYENMQQEFKSTSDQYACLSDKDELNIFFRIYDENMREKGIGIVQISQSAVAKVLETVQLYHNGGWAVLDKNDQLLASEGAQELVKKLQTSENSWNGTKDLAGTKVIGYGNLCGFGVRTVISVGYGNIFSILKPTLFIVLVGLIVVLGIAFLVAYAISYRFTKPVTRMIQSIQAFGKPDLNARMEDSSIQEFHDMGIVFNEMADRIEYLITQVYEKEIVAARSQVKYLQSQINPHFQFNILAMLSLKAKMAGNEEVYDGLNAFSRLMQGKIFREKEIKIKVKEELEIVQFYLYLQKSRYQDKLSYEVKLEDEKIGEDLIPRLLIEPLVENAVSHGLEPKRGKGNLQVLLYEREMLYIWVKDDGVGVCRNQTKAEENKEKTPHTHVGWENTKKMLRILYGDHYKFQVWSEPGKGTEIEIAVPIERGGNYVESDSSR
ncbi:Inner membrane protein ypdA [uncultured Blautia sp.]|uniref:cache domain-containing sensor histidine kinase n=1 Tax=uncultured Clostridium sp. TaxID=59620 RepID=UPI000820A091|nr:MULTISPECIES: histidine kinase [Clostridia]SCJ73978.1 Inner membrane protein ypdA [uncultured Blautia sp.]SCK03602.1 Inner membrane protein ypdA [uncultured Clostridium sp.]